MDFLTEKEKNLIKAFYNNEEMRNAVKKFLFHGLLTECNIDDLSDNSRNWVFNIDPDNYTDEKYAQIIRTTVKSIIILQNKFFLMEAFTKKEKKEEKENPAR